MKYQTIYISNVLESYYRGYDQLPEAEKQSWYRYDFLEANRAVLYGADNKVVVTSYPINPEYLKDLEKTTGWQNVLNLYPDEPKPSISLDLINNPVFKAKLIDLIKSNPGISLIQYRSTPEFHQLVEFLHQEKLDFQTPELIAGSDEFILNYYNTKRGFRHLWSGVMDDFRTDINIPEGYICGDLEEAIEAAWWFRNHNRSFVFKYNRGVQGVGVVLNRVADFANSKTEFIKQLKSRLTENFWQEPAIVVEELIEPDTSKLGGSPDVELFVDRNGEVEFSYPCEQILENDKKFIGVYIHPELLKFPQMQAAKQAGMALGKVLSQKGYRGCFDVDMVIDKQGRAFAVEANLRRTGGTHLHELATALLGKNYWQKAHIMSLDLKLKQPLSYLEIKNRLGDLNWQKQFGQGVILINPDLLSQQILIPLFIANNKKILDREVSELKKRLPIAQ